MKFIDLWSIISGVASVISLFISLGSKLENWKKYTLPLSYLLGGFALGRISYVVPQGAEQLFTDSYSAGLVVLILAVLIILAGFAFIFVRKNESQWAYIILMLGSLIFAPQVIRLYTESYTTTPPNDYLILVNEKERTGNFEEAIQYLEKYKNKTSNLEIKELTDKRINTLKEKLAGKISNNNPNN